MTLELHPEAEREMFAALDWYAEQDTKLALRLRAELRTAPGEIEDGPSRFPPYLLRTRRYLLKRFPYAVVFDAAQHSILVLAFAHHRREAGYWSERVD